MNPKDCKKYGILLTVVAVVLGWYGPGYPDPDTLNCPGDSYALEGAQTAYEPLGSESKKRMPSIRNPGCDFADFPNSAEVVPPGVYYMEIAPTTQWSNQPDSRQSGLELLFRAGLIKDLELRLSGSGITVIDSDEPGADAFGTGPFAIGVKYHALDGAARWFRPAVGIEFQAALPVAAPNAINPESVLPSGSLNVDHTLPNNLSFHWNIGFQTSLDDDRDPFLQASLKWSIAYNATGDLQLYLTGDSSFPAIPSGGGTLLLGVGFIWTVRETISAYTTVAADFATGPGFAGALKQFGAELGGYSQIGVSFAF